MKLFLHEILPSEIARAIFIDTDAMLIVDPYRESTCPLPDVAHPVFSGVEPIHYVLSRHPF